MRTRAGWIAKRIASNVQSAGTDVGVLWLVAEGGTVDLTTRAVVGGSQTLLSGTLKAFGITEPPRNVVRTYAEIKAGDLILDLAPNPMVTISPNQMLSGCLALSSLEPNGLRFIWGGELYAQEKIGEGLATTWDAIMNNQQMHTTVLLRLAT